MESPQMKNLFGFVMVGLVGSSSSTSVTRHPVTTKGGVCSASTSSGSQHRVFGRISCHSTINAAHVAREGDTLELRRLLDYSARTVLMEVTNVFFLFTVFDHDSLSLHTGPLALASFKNTAVVTSHS